MSRMIRNEIWLTKDNYNYLKACGINEIISHEHTTLWSVIHTDNYIGKYTNHYSKKYVEKNIKNFEYKIPFWINKRHPHSKRVFGKYSLCRINTRIKKLMYADFFIFYTFRYNTTQNTQTEIILEFINKHNLDDSLKQIERFRKYAYRNTKKNLTNLTMPSINRITDVFPLECHSESDFISLIRIGCAVEDSHQTIRIGASIPDDNVLIEFRFEENKTIFGFSLTNGGQLEQGLFNAAENTIQIRQSNTTLDDYALLEKLSHQVVSVELQFSTGKKIIVSPRKILPKLSNDEHGLLLDCSLIPSHHVDCHGCISPNSFTVSVNCP